MGVFEKRVERMMYEFKRQKLQEAGENYIKRSLIIVPLYQIVYFYSHKMNYVKRKRTECVCKYLSTTVLFVKMMIKI